MMFLLSAFSIGKEITPRKRLPRPCPHENKIIPFHINALSANRKEVTEPVVVNR